MSSHSFHELIYHVVWATKDRMPVIADEIRPAVVGILMSEASDRGGFPIACNTMPDHVHMLVRIPPSIAVATFIGQVKGASSRAINGQGGERRLEWQQGYFVLTLRKSDIPVVLRYVEEQQVRHKDGRLWRSLERTEEDDE